MEGSALIRFWVLGRDGVIQDDVVGYVLEEAGMVLRFGTSSGCA